MGIREGIREFFSSKDDSDYPDSYNRHYRAYTSPYGRDTPLPVLEMQVPLCCDGCEKKVREALEDLSGVKEVITDRENNLVSVTGFVDPLKALRKVKKVKPRSDLHGDNTYINRASIESRPVIAPLETSRWVTNPYIRTPYEYPRDDGRVHYVASPLMALTPVARPLARTNSYGRRMTRLPSFSRAERYDDWRRTSLVPLDVGRDYYGGIRRMPSFDKYRYHDAEYVSMGDEFSPSIPETRYVSLYNKRPADVYRKQVSFSKLPVMNPYYMKHIDHESNH